MSEADFAIHQCLDDGDDPLVTTKLSLRCFDVGMHSGRTYGEDVTDFTVGLSYRNPFEYLTLTFGKYLTTRFLLASYHYCALQRLMTADCD